MPNGYLILFGALALTPASGALERSFAEVVLSVPGCDLFVVKTPEGFTTVRKREHWAIFEGDQVRGALHVSGDGEIEILGEMTLAATVESWALDLKSAKRLFYHSCIPLRERLLDGPDR
jgi:hypothetical protein